MTRRSESKPRARRRQSGPRGVAREADSSANEASEKHVAEASGEPVAEDSGPDEDLAPTDDPADQECERPVPLASDIAELVPESDAETTPPTSGVLGADEGIGEQCEVDTDEGVGGQLQEMPAPAGGPDDGGASLRQVPAGSEADDGPADVAAAPTGERLKQVLESLVFVADKPATVVQLARIVRERPSKVSRVLDELAEEYAGRGIQLVQVGGGFVFRTAPSNAQEVRAFISHRPVRLTRAQLETLSIVAYRQPVTRPEIEDVRGVDTGSAIRVLLDRGLLKMLGRKDEPGRPMLYGTAPHFLEFFGLKRLSDLPTLREFTDLTEESRDLYMRRTGEAPENGAEAPGDGEVAMDAGEEAPGDGEVAMDAVEEVPGDNDVAVDAAREEVPGDGEVAMDAVEEGPGDNDVAVDAAGEEGPDTTVDRAEEDERDPGSDCGDETLDRDDV